MDSEKRISIKGALQPDICNDFRIINGIRGGIRRFNTSRQPLSYAEDVTSATLSPRSSIKKVKVASATTRTRKAKSQMRGGKTLDLSPRQTDFDLTLQRTGLSVGLVAGTDKN